MRPPTVFFNDKIRAVYEDYPQLIVNKIEIRGFIQHPNPASKSTFIDSEQLFLPPTWTFICDK